MGKYKLFLKNKKSDNDISLICDTAQEALAYKKKAVKLGYQVEVKRLNDEENTTKV